MPKKNYNYAQLEAVAQEMRANADMVFFYEYQTPTATLPTGEVLDLAKEFGATVEYDPDISKVSVVGLGMRSHAGVAAKVFGLLAAEGINIQAISTSEIKISCIIAAKYTELAIRTLHEGLGLDKSTVVEQ